MKVSRLVLITFLVLGIVGLTAFWGGRPPETVDGSIAEIIPESGSAQTLSSTWYCAAGGLGESASSTHEVLLANPSKEVVPVRMTAYNAQGPVGEPKIIASVAQQVTPVDVNAVFGGSELSVMAEFDSGALAVQHRITTATSADSVPCSTTSSKRWFFPAQTSVLGSSALLVLFNPFSADAGVDITAAVQDGLRSPKEWAGIVVPAGTSRVIDLGQYVQRRDQFSVAVRLRNGSLIAESAQSFDIAAAGDAPAERGLRLQLGVPEARSGWTFAGGFKGEGVAEQLVVYNPGKQPASVIVQVTPYGGAGDPPEPFELTVPARRFLILDLSAEQRIPDTGFHAIRVETSEGTPVVAARTTQLFGPPPAVADPAVGTRPNETLGVAIGTGTPVYARRWTLPAVRSGPEQQPMLMIHNPSSGIVTLNVRALSGKAAPIDIETEVEVGAGDSIFVSLPMAKMQGSADWVVTVRASGEVAVEQLLTFATQNDLSFGSAVAVLGPG
ncbi:MAG: DUF5719 family protein [Actinomycetes bacterium]